MEIGFNPESKNQGEYVTPAKLRAAISASEVVQNGVDAAQDVKINDETIVKRDSIGAGGFSAGTIKATGLEVSGSAKLFLPLKDAAGANIIDIGTNSKYGKMVMPSLTTGSNNIGIGEGILPNGTTASANTYIGYNISTSSNSTASYNTAVGESAMRFVGNNNNTAVGHQSMRDLTSGTFNTAIGMNSGYSASFLTTGSQNTLIGALARLVDGTSSNATAIGYQAQADGSNTIQLGNAAVATVKTSGTLYAAGLESIGTTLTIAGQNNTSVVDIGKGTGVQAINLGNNGTGATTISLGGGSDVVKVNLPLKDSAGTNVLNAAGSNTTLGANAGMDNVLGSGNTFVGFESGKKGNGAGLTLNTAVGHSSLLNIVDGRDNVAVGHAALVGLTSGNTNTSIGKGSGGVSTGSGNTFLGSFAAATVGTVTNSTAIGSGAQVDANNMIQLGNASVNAVKTSGTLYALGLESTGTTLTIAGQNNTSVVDIGKGTGVQTINLGNNGTGATVINLGGAGDTVNISGTLNNVTTTNTQVQDSTLVLNSGGAASTAGLSGIYFEEAGSSANSYMRVSSDRSKIELKAPTGTLITLNQSMTKADSVLLKQVAAEGIDMTKVPTSGAAVLAWNRLGNGRTTFANQGTTAAGGWEWLNYDNTLTPAPSANPQMILDRDGNLSVIGTASSAVVPTTANHLTNKAYVDAAFPAVQYHSVLSNFAGPYTIPAGSQQYIRLARIGTVVTATVTGYNGNLQVTNPTLFQNPDPIPEAFRPHNSSVIVAAKVTDNGVSEMGTAEIRTDGMITIGTSYEKSRLFTSGGIANFNGFTVSYVVL